MTTVPAADEAEPNAVIGNGPNSATAVRDYVCVLSKVGEDGLEEHIGTFATLNGAKDRGLKLATEWRTKPDKADHPAKDNPWVRQSAHNAVGEEVLLDLWELRLADREHLNIVREVVLP